MTMAQAEEGSLCVHNNEGASDRQMPLFLFFTCESSGRDFMRHKMLDVSVRCWPYAEDAPAFYRRVDHDSCRRNGRKAPCRKNGNEQKSQDSISQHAALIVEEFLRWIDDTVGKASLATGLEMYPVLMAHGGETFQFLFFFRMLERYDILAMDTLAAHSVHFADPVPVLKQYKDAKHTLLVGSRSLGLGSLLNDWFPAGFDETDLMRSRSRGSLVIKLYTQCPLYWLLYSTPIYNTEEWLEFYQSQVCYLKDKWELQEKVPSSVTGIQRKLSIKHLLKNGYSWSGLLDLYKTCGSSQHFWQELRDIDIKSGTSRKITLAIDALNLEQDGSREYKLRIKSTMPFAKYYYLTDARGRRFELHVANALPPCIYRLDDLAQDCWKVPENLLQISWSDVRNAVMGWSPFDDEDDAELAAGLKDVALEESDSDEDWQDSDVTVFQNGELPEEFCQKAQPTHVPTTLVTGIKAVNPFASSLSEEWTAVDKSDETSFPKLNPDPPSTSLTSNSQSDVGVAASSANHVVPARSSTSAQTNQKFSRSGKPSSANRRAHARPGKSQWYNQKDRSKPSDLTSPARESRTTARHWTSASTDGRPSKSHQCNSSNQTICTAASHDLTSDSNISPASPTSKESPPVSPVGQSEDCTRFTRPKASQSQYSGPFVQGTAPRAASKGSHSLDSSVRKKKGSGLCQL